MILGKVCERKKHMANGSLFLASGFGFGFDFICVDVMNKEPILLIMLGTFHTIVSIVASTICKDKAIAVELAVGDGGQEDL